MRPSPRNLRTRIGLVGLIATMVLSSLAFGSTDFVVPPGRSPNPYTIVTGPDHNLWFVEAGGEKVGRITTAGVITEFPITGAQSLVGIASGSDGNLWFTDQLTGKVGHISTSGTGITQFALPTGSYPQGITSGPDGNLWFVEQKLNGLFKVGKMTTAGVLTEFATNINLGTYQLASNYGYASIVSGPDGNLWFVDPQNAINYQIGKITTSGAITFYPLADLPLGVAAGPDGNLWAAEFSHVAKITTSGVETEYLLLIGNLEYFASNAITSGPDGNLWLVTNNNFIIKVTTAGALTLYSSVYPPIAYVPSITSGPDGALWLTGELTSEIGRMNTSGQITNTYALSPGSIPVFAALGSDNNVWFSQGGLANSVGNISTSGVSTTYPLPSANAEPWSLTNGPDGNIWFLEVALGQVAKITPSGVVTEYPDADVYASQGLTSGSDGNIWFTAPATTTGPSIGRITTSGVITVFSLPAGSSPQFITSGPDGNLWFTDSSLNVVGKMNTSGDLLAEYPITTAFSNPSVLTTGPDGNVWFIENTEFGAVAKITTAGVVTEYPVQLQNYQDGIVAGPDGAMWIAQGYPNSVARITTSGVVSTVALTSSNALGNALIVGADGKLWIDEATAGAMGRMSAIGGIANNIRAIYGLPFENGKVATFVDGTSSATSSNFTASIAWGDGATSTGIVTGGGGSFTVRGTHTYVRPGDFPVSVSLTDNVDNSTYLSSTAKAVVVK